MTAKRSATVEEGVQFPLTEGRRSSQSTGIAVCADAARSVDAELATRIETTPDWHKRYLAPFRDLVELGARSSKNALRVASDGLDALHNRLVFVREGEELPLPDAFKELNQTHFETAVVEGRDKKGKPKLSIPYRGELLEDDALARQLDRWEGAGTIEPSAAEAIKTLMANPEWLDLSDRHFALLGTTAEMGPLQTLSRWRANVLAVDLPRPSLWERIVAVARAGNGRVHIPTRQRLAGNEEKLPGIAGADLITEAPKIRSWLASFDEPFALANYAYTDGTNFVRLAAALDALTIDLLERRRDLSIAYLASPTDVFAVSEETVQPARARRRGGPRRALLHAPIAAASRRRLYSPNYERLVVSEEGRRWGISDCLVPQQGANYALAKTLQRWRATVAREGGALTSANVAPATRTASVIRNRVLAAAYAGAGAFGVEIFEPETSSALMAALLVHDVRNTSAPAHPGAAMTHPFDLFTQGAAHGGIWQLPYQPRSILPLAVVIGLARRRGGRRDD